MQRLLTNAGPIAHLSGNGPISGVIDAEEYVSERGLGILVEDHVISRIAPSEELVEEYTSAVILDLEDKAIVPGLVDSHTHLLWKGDRSREVAWKQNGMSYREIADNGGGINATVSPTRHASNSELAHSGIERMRRALRNGTTHMEAKSGYGLDTDSELRLLEVAQEISKIENLPTLDLTWLGAHVAPKGYSIQSYFEEILSEQLPAILDQGIARSADVFCEPGWFSLEQSEEILKQSRSGGLDLRIHIDEFVDGGGGDLAAELQVTTADHAHYTNDESRSAMNKAGVNTGFLPGTPYSMGAEYPPFEHCIENNWVWSIASDFNPNCRTLSLPFLASVLVQRNDISPITSLAACTRNSAETTPHPSGLKHGQICEGGVANLNIVDGPLWEAWCLQPGHTPFAATMLEGEMIFH
ncbi:MAG: imidazolonepropionase [Candidatus Poseidoniales archaeon]|nr:MAG: imidazolonepropionase [Candidatus Poseidoniales archaeon]